MAEHLGINGKIINLYVSINTNLGYSGQYNNINGRISITLVLYPGIDTEVVTAILSHELMHAYLDYRGIRLRDTKSNEILTDTASVYFGFSEYMYKGYSYKPTNTSNYHKVGYISAEDVRFLFKEIYN